MKRHKLLTEPRARLPPLPAQMCPWSLNQPLIINRLLSKVKISSLDKSDKGYNKKHSSAGQAATSWCRNACGDPSVTKSCRVAYPHTHGFTWKGESRNTAQYSNANNMRPNKRSHQWCPQNWTHPSLHKAQNKPSVFVAA